MANVTAQKRAKNMANKVSSSNTLFRTEVLNKSVHLLALNKRSILAHCRIQVAALSDKLDQRKVNEATASRLAAILYSELRNKLDGYNSPAATKHLLGNSASDRKLKASSGLKFAGSTRVYRFRPKKNSSIYASLASKIFEPANLKGAAFLNQFSLSGVLITPGNDVLDIGHLFSSSVNFKATLRGLLKASERLPKEKRAEYRQNIKQYAAKEVKNVSTSYRDNNWGLEITYQHNISLKELSSTAVVVVSPQSESANRGEIKKAEQAAVSALLSFGSKAYEDILLNTTSSPSVLEKIEQMLVDATVTTITKAKRNRNNKGRFLSKREVFKAITGTKSVRGRAAVWKLEGREALKDVTKNLLGIQNVINEFLPQYMQRNMGKGSSKTVLNYRTGRLADSASIDFIRPIRRDLIEAKVSYMTNPYSTFSKGGDQDMPRSRDPKRLVDRSIRQILKEKLQLAMAFKSELT